jgi:hypothetical protein
VYTNFSAGILVTPEIIETVIAPDLNALVPTLTRRHHHFFFRRPQISKAKIG